jgi:hypothetical protein
VGGGGASGHRRAGTGPKQVGTDPRGYAVAETSRELHEAEVKILGLAFAAEVKTTDGVVATLNDLAAARS